MGVGGMEEGSHDIEVKDGDMRYDRSKLAMQIICVHVISNRDVERARILGKCVFSRKGSELCFEQY